MSLQRHWDSVYNTKAPSEVSWFRPHLEVSLSLINRSTNNRRASIIDIGGGESTLVDDLLARKFSDVTVLDISQIAVDVTKTRLGNAANQVKWLVGDVTQIDLPANTYDVWHDRAVFHFLTDANQRSAYVRRVAESVKKGGHVIVGTFGPQGPTKCSGLDVQRYDSDALHNEFGSRFHLIDSQKELHQTPFGTIQQFLYCFCIVR